MVIKPDPNKSIFKSSPNPAFFNQANKKSKDIVLVSKGDSQKFKNNSINNSQNQEIVINIKEKNKTDVDKNNNEKEKELEQNIQVFIRLLRFGVWEKIKEKNYIIEHGLKMKRMKFILVLEIK